MNASISWKIYLYLNLLVVFVLAFLPIVVLVLFSWNQSAFPILPWTGATILWYEQLVSDTKIMEAIANSFFVGVGTALLSLIIGFAGAHTIFLRRNKTIDLLRFFAFAPPLVPYVVSGIAFVTLLNFVPIPKSIFSIILFQSVIFVPLAIGTIYLRLKEIGYGYADVVTNLGGSYTRYVFSVLLPMLMPTLVGTALFVFALSWDEFIISWFVGGFSETIPVRVWLSMKSTLSPTINALGTISFFLSLTLLLFAQHFLRKKKYVS